MPKRFLNVEYSGTRTEVDVTEAERLGEVRRAIKAEYGPVTSDVGAPQLQLYDQQGHRITDLKDIPDDYYKEPKNGGLFLAIRTSPPPTREPSRNDHFAKKTLSCTVWERQRRKLSSSSPHLLRRTQLESLLLPISYSPCETWHSHHHLPENQAGTTILPQPRPLSYQQWKTSLVKYNVWKSVT